LVNRYARHLKKAQKKCFQNAGPHFFL
jgi:hypothetical protein